MIGQDGVVRFIRTRVQCVKLDFHDREIDVFAGGEMMATKKKRAKPKRLPKSGGFPRPIGG